MNENNVVVLTEIDDQYNVAYYAGRIRFNKHDDNQQTPMRISVNFAVRKEAQDYVDFLNATQIDAETLETLEDGIKIMADVAEEQQLDLDLESDAIIAINAATTARDEKYKQTQVEVLLETQAVLHREAELRNALILSYDSLLEKQRDIIVALEQRLNGPE